MGEKMTNAQAAEILRQHNAWRRGNDDEMPDAPVNPTRLGMAIDHAVAHLTQPAQAVDAWMTDDGRVISDRQKATAIRDGGASASSVAPYIIPLTRAIGNAQAEGWSDLLDGYRSLYRAYVNTLEVARDRIRELGGQCDPVDVMERGDPALSLARERLAKFQSTPPQPEE